MVSVFDQDSVGGVPASQPNKEDEEPGEQDYTMEWDETPIELPAELAFLWNGAANGDRKLNLAAISKKSHAFSNFRARPQRITIVEMVRGTMTVP